MYELFAHSLKLQEAQPKDICQSIRQSHNLPYHSSHASGPNSMRHQLQQASTKHTYSLSLGARKDLYAPPASGVGG